LTAEELHKRFYIRKSILIEAVAETMLATIAATAFTAAAIVAPDRAAQVLLTWLAGLFTAVDLTVLAYWWTR
jgi:hypothetical protein